MYMKDNKDLKGLLILENDFNLFETDRILIEQDLPDIFKDEVNNYYKCKRYINKLIVNTYREIIEDLNLKEALYLRESLINNIQEVDDEMYAYRMEYKLCYFDDGVLRSNLGTAELVSFRERLCLYLTDKIYSFGN